MDYHYDSSGADSPASRPQSISSFRSGLSPLLTEQTSLSSASDLHLIPCNENFIAVVGGLGYIGSHTCLELLKSGYNIIIIDNLSNSFRSVYTKIETIINGHCEARCEPVPLMRLYEADYRDETAMAQILEGYIENPQFIDPLNRSNQPSSRIKGVIHFGAFKSVSESIQNPLKYYANNVSGLVGLCSILNRFNIKTFIFSSSATVYGSVANSGKPLREEYCTHQTEVFMELNGEIKTVDGGCTGLTSPYGRTKWMCEAILSDLAVADPDWTIIALRYFNPVGCDDSGILGEDPRGTPTNLMPVVVRVMDGQSPALEVFGANWPTPDGTAIRDFIHVTDLARGHIAALAAASDGRVPKIFRTYNLGSGQGHSVMDIVTAMEAVSSTEIPIQITERREGDVGTCVAVAMRAGIELDWKAETSLETCCRDICNFLGISKSQHALSG